jgi:hypothetical protein
MPAAIFPHGRDGAGSSNALDKSSSCRVNVSRTNESRACVSSGCTLGASGATCCGFGSGFTIGTEKSLITDSGFSSEAANTPDFGSDAGLTSGGSGNLVDFGSGARKTERGSEAGGTGFGSGGKAAGFGSGANDADFGSDTYETGVGSDM